MKISKKLTTFLSVTALSAMLLNCKDEVIVPVEDKSTADSLVTKIFENQGKKVEINTELNTLTLTNTELQDSISELQENWTNISGTERIIQYTVNVVSFGNTTLSNGRTTGLSGATVLVQQNGTQQTQSTSDGLAEFEVKQGYVTVSVTAPDHSSIEYTAFVGYDDYYDGKERNAASQVFLFPIAGANSATISGNVFMNGSTLDDTLNYYTYGAAAGASLQGKYITNPGPWAGNNWGYGNMTQDWDYRNDNSIYGSVGSNNIKWNNVEGYKLTVVPQIFDVTDQYEIPNNIWGSIQHGKIISMTYKGMLKFGTTDANGSFTISGIPTTVEGLEVQILTPEDGFIRPHTRFTTGAASDEVGATSMDFKVYNTGTNAATTVSKKVKSENRYYFPYLYRMGSDWTIYLRSGETHKDAIFLFPGSLSSNQ
jgi:hypothetical protein